MLDLCDLPLWHWRYVRKYCRLIVIDFLRSVFVSRNFWLSCV